MVRGIVKVRVVTADAASASHIPILSFRVGGRQQSPSPSASRSEGEQEVKSGPHIRWGSVAMHEGSCVVNGSQMCQQMDQFFVVLWLLSNMLN